MAALVPATEGTLELMPMRPCIQRINGRACGRLSHSTRCEEHTASHEAARQASPDRIYSDPRYKRWREVVRLRGRGRCARCGRMEADLGQTLETDHIIPVLDGGPPFDPRNGQLLCPECHDQKGQADRAARRK